MKAKQAGRPIRPGIASAAQEGNIWGAFACELIKQTLEERGFGYKELAERLGNFDLTMTPTAVNRRINRGNFSAGFLLACLQALEVSNISFLDERLGTTSTKVDSPEQKSDGASRSKGSTLPLEDILLNFGSKNRGTKPY